MRTLVILAAALVSGCASSSAISVPVGIGGGMDDLKASSCRCGGLESKKSHKERQKRKARAAKTGEINTDIVRDQK